MTDSNVKLLNLKTHNHTSDWCHCVFWLTCAGGDCSHVRGKVSTDTGVPGWISCCLQLGHRCSSACHRTLCCCLWPHQHTHIPPTSLCFTCVLSELTLFFFFFRMSLGCFYIVLSAHFFASIFFKWSNRSTNKHSNTLISHAFKDMWQIRKERRILLQWLRSVVLLLSPSWMLDVEHRLDSEDAHSLFRWPKLSWPYIHTLTKSSLGSLQFRMKLRCSHSRWHVYLCLLNLERQKNFLHCHLLHTCLDHDDQWKFPIRLWSSSCVEVLRSLSIQRRQNACESL